MNKNIPARKSLRDAVALLIGACFVMNPCFAAQPSVTLESLLAEMVDYDSMAKWPEPGYTTHQASSRDLGSKSPTEPGWFVNHDYSVFVRSELNGKKREWVMMEANGPGCVTRIWYGGNVVRGNLRVYLDGASEPVIDAPLHALMSGRDVVPEPLSIEIAPIVEEKKPGGLNLFLPIPYARQCRIVYYVQDTPKPPHFFFYNIEYRTYAEGTVVQTLQREDLQTQKALIEQTTQTLLNPKVVSTGQPFQLDRTIAPGEEVSLNLPAGTAAVRELKLQVKPADEEMLAETLRSTILKARFDDEEAIWCPVSDFAGSGIGLNELQSWYRTVDKEGWMTSRWVMPYSKSAQFSVENLGDKPVTISLKAIVGDWKWDERSMLFHATWRSEQEISTRPPSDWNFISIQGKGVYMGDTLSIFNPFPAARWWGEGDEKITIDKATFPQHFGTGTEDYYCYAWGNTKLFQTPFANQPRADGVRKITQNHTTVTRTRNLDRIPFTHDLNLDMEIWHWEKNRIDFAVASYWYARPGATHNRTAQKDQAILPIKKPTTLSPSATPTSTFVPAHEAQ